MNNSKYQLANDYFYVGDAQAPMSGVPTHRVKVGEPIGQIWGWKVLDITEDGKWIYEDQNGNAVESKDVKIEDRKVIVMVCQSIIWDGTMISVIKILI